MMPRNGACQMWAAAADHLVAEARAFLGSMLSWVSRYRVLGSDAEAAVIGSATPKAAPSHSYIFCPYGYSNRHQPASQPGRNTNFRARSASETRPVKLQDRAAILTDAAPGFMTAGRPLSMFPIRGIDRLLG